MSMDNVVHLRRQKPETIKSMSHRAVIDAAEAVGGDPEAVLVVALGGNGQFSLRFAHDTDTVREFDVMARAEAVIQRTKLNLLD